jgi:lysophospholipase L1-like esterase
MRICFVGDSMVNGTGDFEHLGWVGRVLQDERTRRPELTGYNLGVRRDRADQIRAHWKTEVERRLPPEHEGRAVFSFGVNDAAQERDPALTLADAEAILTEAKMRWPVLMVGTVPMPDAAVRARSRSLDQAFAPLCARLDVPCLSVFDGLMATPQWLGEARAGDGAHPGAGGYSRMAGLILASPVWRKWMAA